MMELVLSIFVGLWVAAGGYIAYLAVKKEYEESTKVKE